MKLRPRHPNKAIEQALRFAEGAGWRVELRGSGHAWARLYCPRIAPLCRGGEFCQISVWSTPKNAEQHAKWIAHLVKRCMNGEV